MQRNFGFEPFIIIPDFDGYVNNVEALHRIK